MKLGFITAILEEYTYEQMMDFASAQGFDCVEAACWPAGKGERRYAGTSHIDVERVLTDQEYADHICDYSREKELVKQIWPPILELAKECKVKVAIENCPMLFGPEQWPGGQNLMTTPANWRKIFEILPYDNLGINYDPSHFVWQMIDYIKPLYEFKDKIFHIHYKDIKVYPDKFQDCGIMAYPLDYM